MLEVTCPNCRKLLHVVETATGRDSQCPACGTVFRPETVWRSQSPPPAPPTARRWELIPRTVAHAGALDSRSGGEASWPAKTSGPAAAAASGGPLNLLRLGWWGFVGGMGLGCSVALRADSAGIMLCIAVSTALVIPAY